jgi:hypothetical protein
MNAATIVWGLILLIGLGWASPMSGLSEAQLWMAWAIIFVVGSYALGKTVHKKASKESMASWMHVLVFGLIVSFAAALGYVAFPLSSLMSLWLILFGAAMWKAADKNMDAAVHGVVTALVGVALPLFGANYWMTGAIFLGLGPIICSILSKKD